MLLLDRVGTAGGKQTDHLALKRQILMSGGKGRRIDASVVALLPQVEEQALDQDVDQLTEEILGQRRIVGSQRNHGKNFAEVVRYCGAMVGNCVHTRLFVLTTRLPYRTRGEFFQPLLVFLVRPDSADSEPRQNRSVEFDSPPARSRGHLVAVSAYILIQTVVGKSASVRAAVGAIEGIVASDGVTGQYDVIARGEADNLDDLAKLVVRQVQQIPGTTRTLTCPVVHL